MGSETALWATVRRRLGPHGLFERIENRVGAGTPDVVYCIDGFAGWLELKQVDDWPKRDKLTIRHLTTEQVMWMQQWRENKGCAWILLQVAKDYLFLPPQLIVKASKAELIQRSALHQTPVLDVRGAINQLTRGVDPWFSRRKDLTPG